MASSRRPAPFSVGEIRVRAVRPPTATDPRWYWRAMHGAKETVWSGRATRSEVETEVIACALRLMTGKETVSVPGAAEASTVAEAMAFYLGDCKERVDAGQLATATLDNYLAQRRRIRAGLGRTRVDRLTGRQIEVWTRKRLTAGEACLTVRSDLILLKAGLHWCASVGLCEEVRIAWPRVEAKRKRPKPTPTREEIARVWEALGAWPNEQDAFLFLASTGARQGELNALSWPDVDLRASTVALNGKTGARIVPVAGDCLSMLRRRRLASTGDGAVFGSRARGVTLCQRKLPQACAAAGVARWTPHAIRRFVSSELIERGTDARTYEAIMGHTLQVGLRDYAESRAETRRGAIEAAGLGSVLSTSAPTVVGRSVGKE